MTAAAIPKPTGQREACPRCGITETVLLPLSSGHIGRVCGECRMLRHPKPYASKSAYYANHPKPVDGQKDHLCNRNLAI